MGPPQEGLTATGVRPVVHGWLHALALDRRGDFNVVEIDDRGRVEIPCGEGIHTARVAGGRFVLDDHDVDAELALVVFGAEPPTCLVYEAVWDGSGSDGFLTEWASDPDDDRLAKAAEDWYGNYWESWPTEPAAARVLFGPRLQRELAIATARSWVQWRGADGPGSAWADVRRGIAMRARRAIVLSLAGVDAHRRPDALVPVAVAVVPEGEPSLTGMLSRTASRIEVRLPVRWLWDVWAVDGARDNGRFVLDREGDVRRVVEWLPTGAPGREHHPVVRSERG